VDGALRADGPSAGEVGEERSLPAVASTVPLERHFPWQVDLIGYLPGATVSR